MYGSPVKFDPADHSYTTPDGRRLPGITAILRKSGLLYEIEENSFADPTRGDRVHQAIHFDCENDLDESTVHADDFPIVEAARKFRRDYELEILSVEEAIGNEPMGYATKIDLVARWGGQLATFNWKTGSEYRFHAIQSALEALCFSPEPVSRWSVYLSEKGYKPVEHTARTDFIVAKAAITCMAWTKGGKSRG